MEKDARASDDSEIWEEEIRIIENEPYIEELGVVKKLPHIDVITIIRGYQKKRENFIYVVSAEKNLKGL